MSKERDPQNFFTPERIFKLMEHAQKLVVPGECDTSDCLARLINEDLREELGPKLRELEPGYCTSHENSLGVLWSPTEAYLFCQRETGK